jgi:tetratricopeptide (TPR) repeat protein
MRILDRTLGLGVIGAIALGAARAPERPRATELLDGYLRGEYGTVVQAFSDESSLDGFLRDLEAHGSAWIDAAGPAERDRRELAAAVVALEAARAGEWREWKLRLGMTLPSDPGGPPRPPTIILYWKAPPLLIEWACELMREGHQPRALERAWFLASVAVAERAEDYEFMVGDTKLDELADKGVSEYNSDVIQHVRHARLQFPDEPRFKLAQAIAEEWHDPESARAQYEGLQSDVDLRGEATMRLGVMAFWRHADDQALAQLRKVPSLTRDPWVLGMAWYVAGRIADRRHRPDDAERDYRLAVSAVPDSEAATVSLASLLFRGGRRDEASSLVEHLLAASPTVADPWRGYADGDDRFWPQLIATLREAIHP